MADPNRRARKRGRRIVITSFGSYGDTFPYVGLALGLRRRGHDPVLAMPEFYRHLVASEDLAFHPVRPDVDPRNRELVRRIMDPTRGPEFIIRHLMMGSLRESFADLSAAAEGADLLVTHPITFAGPVIAELRGLPWISTVLAPMSFFSRHDMPVFPPAPWMKRLERVPGVAAALVGMAKRVTRSWSGPIRDLRRELGLGPGLDPVHEGQHSPHGVLALFSRELAEPQPDWPANVTVTGAIPYNGPDADRPLSAGLRDFLAAGEPPVVFTLGSSAVGVAGDFYERSVEAVGRLGVRAVLLVGPHAENRPGASLHDRIRLEEFASHAALFPAATAIVHQGGAGTLHQALRSGRPSLVVPFANDQPDNAWRAQRLGVARVVAANRFTTARAVRELGALLNQAGYRERAEAVAARVRAEEGVENACDVIEAVVERGGGRPASA